MSVLSKMTNTLNTEKFLSEIYKSIKSEIQQNNNINTEKAKARRIEAFLNLIKYAQAQSQNGLNVNNLPFSKFWSTAEQISLLNKLNEVHPELFTKSVFLNQSSDPNILGRYLEEGLNRTMKTFESTIRTGKYDKGMKKGIGAKHAQIPDLIGISNDYVSYYIKEAYNHARNSLAQYNKNPNLSQYINYVPTIQGKIDTVGLSADIQVSMGSNFIEQDLIHALKGATFTAKNYISSNDIKLGQTNPFRIFSVLTYDTGEDASTRYYRMIQCFKSHNNSHSQAPTYFYRLRALYELTGYGLQYVKENVLSQIMQGKTYAKFLVWNNPMGGLRVISTQSIINKIFDSVNTTAITDWKEAMYSKITIPQQELNQI